MPFGKFGKPFYGKAKGVYPPGVPGIGAYQLGKFGWPWWGI